MKRRLLVEVVRVTSCMLIAANANAAIESTGILDTVLYRYTSAASKWADVILYHASVLFGTLALISLIWTFGLMALRKADIAEFFAEFFRFTVFTGFYWWLLREGPKLAIAVMDSMKEIGTSASHTPAGLRPSGVIDIGFDIYGKIVAHSLSYGIIDGLASIFVGLAILVALTLVSVNMLMLLVSSWILAYAGIFFLGFGGSRWTSEMALGYYKTVISMGGQLLAMILLVGVGQSVLLDYVGGLSATEPLEELGIILVISLVLLILVNKIPGLIGSLAMGGGTGALGGGFGAGHAIGAMTMAATAGASAAAGFVSAAANTSGAMKAVQAAYQKAQSAESASGSETGTFADAPRGGPDLKQDGGSALAAAMGDPSSRADASVDKDSGTSSKNDSPAPSKSAKAPHSDTSSPSNGAGSAAKEPTKNPREQAKPVRLALGTVGNLIGGASSMAKSTFDARVESTMGARLAGLLTTNMADASTKKASQKVDSNTISAGRDDDVDPAAEVAAFRDGPEEPENEEKESSND